MISMIELEYYTFVLALKRNFPYWNGNKVSSSVLEANKITERASLLVSIMMFIIVKVCFFCFSFLSNYGSNWKNTFFRQ